MAGVIKGLLLIKTFINTIIVAGVIKGLLLIKTFINTIIVAGVIKGLLLIKTFINTIIVAGVIKGLLLIKTFAARNSHSVAVKYYVVNRTVIPYGFFLMWHSFHRELVFPPYFVDIVVDCGRPQDRHMSQNCHWDDQEHAPSKLFLRQQSQFFVSLISCTS